MIRIMTLNINGYVEKHGAWPVRRGLILSTVQSAQPDIVALQAVARDAGQFGGQDQAHQLAWQAASHTPGYAEQSGSTDMQPAPANRDTLHEPKGGYPHVYFQPAAAAQDGVEMGTAIISRLPFASTDFLRLSVRPGIEDQTRRVLLKAAFDTPSGPLNLFNAHFSWVKSQLEDNLDEGLPWLSRVTEPALLVGDFNAPAGEGLLYLLEEAGWVDAWKALKGDQPGSTFEAGKTNIRIDYAWANPYLASRLTSIEIVGDQTGSSGEHVSDHYGLLVTIN